MLCLGLLRSPDRIGSHYEPSGRPFGRRFWEILLSTCDYNLWSSRGTRTTPIHDIRELLIVRQDEVGSCNSGGYRTLLVEISLESGSVAPRCNLCELTPGRCVTVYTRKDVADSYGTAIGSR